MITGRVAERLTRDAQQRLLGAALSVVIAVGLFSRFSVYGQLSRDEAIYVYGGQQMTHGVAPYDSIFDPKGPGATLLCGLGAAIARLLNRSDIVMIRLVFLAVALLTVAAVYLLALQLWDSVLGAVAAAIVFASFAGYARLALVGPDAKMPGVLCAVVAMWLAARRQWFWASIAASLAVVVWQPLGLYPLVVIVAAVLCSPDRRPRALGMTVAGAALPIVAVSVYFASVSAFGRLVEAAVIFPVRGYTGGGRPFLKQMQLIEKVLRHYYGVTGELLFCVGLVLLIGLAMRSVVTTRDDRKAALRDPLVLVVLVTLLGQMVFAVQDFHNYPRLYPLLPYAAVGIGGGVALAVRHWPGDVRWIRTALAGGLAVLVVVSAISFGNSAGNNHELRGQEAGGCVVGHLLSPEHPLWVLGDPVPFAVMHRRSPDRFIYLNSGVDEWKIEHTDGRLFGWAQQILATQPPVIIVGGWTGSVRAAMGRLLKSDGYRARYAGHWLLFLTKQARHLARTEGVPLTGRRTGWRHTLLNTRFKCKGG
jgi:hypothetical protein